MLIKRNYWNTPRVIKTYSQHENEYVLQYVERLWLYQTRNNGEIMVN